MDASIRKRANEGKKKMHDMLDSMSESDENESLSKTILKLATCSAAGLLFGIAIEKGRVFEPLVIQDQMTMDRFIMVKMFLSAVSSGIFSFSVLSMIPATQKKFQQASQVFISGFSDKGLFSVGIGAAILGAGMTISGSCPGMVLVQVGAQVPNSLYTFSGALAGALLYGFIEPTVVRLTRPQYPLRTHYLHKYLGSPFSVVALPFGAVMAVIVFGLELFAPWKSELPKSVVESGGMALTRIAWPPFVAGGIIGCLQIPVLLAVGDTLGSSSSYCTVASQILVSSPLQKMSPYLSKFKSGISNWWQVLYIGGAIAGACFSATASGTIGQAAGLSRTAAFSGGVLMVLGSRLAAGCTSGHGLSGMGLLSFLSMLAIPAMFMGGMATAAVVKIF